jgi:hypothetical protein
MEAVKRRREMGRWDEKNGRKKGIRKSGRIES